MPLTRHDTIRKGRSHVEANAPDETLMMSIEQGQYYALGESADQLWRMLDGEVRIADIVDKLVAYYDVAADRCEAEVLPFLEQLLEERLIEKV